MPLTLDPAWMDWFERTHLLGVPLWNWLLALVAALLTLLATRFALHLLERRASQWQAHAHNGLATMVLEVLHGTSRTLLTLASLLVGASLLELPGRWEGRIAQLWFVAVALQVGLWGMRAIGLGVRRYAERHGSAGMTQVSASATLLSWGLRTLLWSVVLLAILSNLGVNITAFVASLGVGGIAVALAVQNILGDLFASLAIAVDKPFEVGDFIVVGDISGTVQVIGLKTTRIRSLQGELVVMSNTDLLKRTISNYRPLQERRVVFGFSVPYGTPADQVERIPQTVRAIVEAQAALRFDRAHLKGFGANALEFEVVYIVQDPDFNLYMDRQQAINLALMRAFEAEGLQFAPPTRVLHVASVPPVPPPAPDQNADNVGTGAVGEDRESGGLQQPAHA